jgi:hypothetical protein
LRDIILLRLRASSYSLDHAKKGRAGTCTFEANKRPGWRQQNGRGRFTHLQRHATSFIFNELGGAFAGLPVW